MEALKDGKYVIGFLIGVICSFVVMGGLNKGDDKVVDVSATDSDMVYEEGSNQQVETILSLDGDENSGDNSVSSQTIVTQKVDNSKITRPEDPHSPELQRLALILRETERMVQRLKADIKAVEQQQTANLADQN